MERTDQNRPDQNRPDQNRPDKNRPDKEHLSHPPKDPDRTAVTPKQERDEELDEDLKDTFPASDPVPPKHVD
jgi:hypothetical protein